MRDGAILRVGELKLVLRMYDRGELADGADEPYVNRGRKIRAVFEHILALMEEITLSLCPLHTTSDNFHLSAALFP